MTDSGNAAKGPWLDDVKGDEAPKLIEAQGAVIRVEAGPGTGKTFGLRRHVLRLLHPDGEGLAGKQVLVVAFNRVIAKQLEGELSEELRSRGISERPEIRTIHALCLSVVGETERLLLAHEREAMIYDLIEMFPEIRAEYPGRSHAAIDQALRDHEAGHSQHVVLWQATTRWLAKHGASLISDLPRKLLDHIAAGDFGDRRYAAVVVDEFQDLTPAEQELFFRLRSDGGEFLALGDSCQSIYKFRGNDAGGLKRLDARAKGEGGAVLDVSLKHCQRCPPRIVEAANQLMQLSGSAGMIPGSSEMGTIALIHWKTPQAEANGMARLVVRSLQEHPGERHLAMVTRRRFGTLLRDAIRKVDSRLIVDLNFEEGLLETWPVREAFLFFCLLVDPDAPTWRAWFSYQRPDDGVFKAPQRNAQAYWRFFQAESERLSEESARRLASELRSKSRGAGGRNLWDRAERFCELRYGIGSIPLKAEAETLAKLFEPSVWTPGGNGSEDIEVARDDLACLQRMANQLLAETITEGIAEAKQLPVVAQRLRYKIGTREAAEAVDDADVQIATLWGAKGVTAEHVFVLGLSGEVLPGRRREEYPGTDDEYREEQRRLFYVSLTRAKKTLILSRANRMRHGDARQLGFTLSGGGHYGTLKMCPFVRDILEYLPASKDGDTFAAELGC